MFLTESTGMAVIKRVDNDALDEILEWEAKDEDIHNGDVRCTSTINLHIVFNQRLVEY